MKIWLKNHKPFSPKSFQFTLFELWREAFKKCDYKVWFALLLMDFSFIVISNMPLLMHQLGLWFPALKAFQINPPWMQTNLFLMKFAALSKFLLPIFLFPLFVSVPVYLGVNLYALRIVYDRPAHFSLLRHYVHFYWWSQILLLGILSGIVLVPLIYVLYHFLLVGYTHNAAYLAQWGVAFTILFVLIFILAVYFSMSYLLIFAARMNVFNALTMSYKATKTHFWRFAAMILVTYLVIRLRVTTYYLSDILFFPPTLIAWMLLYKRSYGEAGLVE